MKYYDLDPEEQALLDSYEKGEWKSVPNVKKEIKRYQSYTRATLAKTRNINIRLSEKTLLKLKAKAVAEGMPYQTLVSSVLHRYAMEK